MADVSPSRAAQREPSVPPDFEWTGTTVRDVLKRAQDERKQGHDSAAGRLFEESMTITETAAALLGKDNANVPALGTEKARKLWSEVEFGAVARREFADYALERKNYQLADKLLTESLKTDPSVVADPERYLQSLLRARTGNSNVGLWDWASKIQSLDSNLSEGKIGSKAEDARVDAMRDSVNSLSAIAVEAGYIEHALSDQRRALNGYQSYSPLEQEVRIQVLADAPTFPNALQAKYLLATGHVSDAEALVAAARSVAGNWHIYRNRSLAGIDEAVGMPANLSATRDMYRAQEAGLWSDIVGLGCGAATVALGRLKPLKALGLGTLAGSLGYSLTKYATTGELKWTDPLWGGLDGMAGASAVLTRNIALERFCESDFAMNAARRAVESTGRRVTDQFSHRALISEALKQSRLGLGQMTAELPWNVRASARIGLPVWLNEERLAGQLAVGEVRQLETRIRTAKDAVRQLSFIDGGMKMAADATGGFVGSAIYRSGSEGRKYRAGIYKNDDEFALACASAVAKDVVGTALGGWVLRTMPPVGLAGRVMKETVPYVAPVMSRDLLQNHKLLADASGKADYWNKRPDELSSREIAARYRSLPKINLFDRPVDGL